MTPKGLFSTTPVEIAVEISSKLWKILALSEISTFPQALFPSACGNVENLKLNLV
jgi:hypothetical protein